MRRALFFFLVACGGSTPPIHDLSVVEADASVVVEAPRVIVDAGPPPFREGTLDGPVKGSPSPGAARLKVRKLPNSKCAVTDLRAFGDCKAIAMKGALVSGGNNAHAAFDGDACSVWNAGGFVPHAIRGEMDPSSVAGVILVPEMTPNGRAVHAIDFVQGESTRAFLADTQFESTETYAITFDAPIAASAIEVRTIASTSWVAWREIVPFTCNGALKIPENAIEIAPLQPRPDPVSDTFHAGRGTCNTDADCVPAQCCHPRICSTKEFAPKCDQIGCSQNVAPETLDVRPNHCGCLNHRCGAWIREVDRGGGLL